MSHPVGYPLSDRIQVGFIEADVEMAFTLVDMAQAERAQGHAAFAGKALESAEAAYGDIEQRLARLAPPVRSTFNALVGELRREIDLARTSE
jgi:hypothetical protein